MHRGAIPVERLGERVSANAVGRRGRFPEGRFLPEFCYEAPPGNAPSGFAQLREPEGRGEKTGKTGRPGPGTDLFKGRFQTFSP